MTKVYQSKRKICNESAESLKTEEQEKIELRERALFIVKALDAQLGNNDDNILDKYRDQFGYYNGDNLPDIVELENEVLKYIIGQDKQVRQIITAIYRARRFNDMKTNVLIIGNSGTGKTEIIKQVAKRLNIPYTIEDATKYTQEGYYGEDVQEMIVNLFKSANYDLEQAQNGILVIDEIDKKNGSGLANDVAGSEVLKSLLKIIEGTIITMPDPNKSPFSGKHINFRTQDIIVILLGAFSGLDKIREKRLNKKQIGFFDEGNDSIQDGKSSRFLKQDLIEYGMTEEFVGRIDTIIEMNTLTKDDLAEILKKSKLSIFKKYKKELQKKNIELYYSRNIFKQIASESLITNTGARELSNTVNYMFENIIYEVLANPGKYRKCKLLNGIVTDNTKYILS